MPRDIDDLLARNRAWAEERVRADPGFFTRLVGGQVPRILWIGCSDSRVPAEQILDCGPGELFIHRNVANIVAYNDINVAAVIQYATEVLEVPDIVVCGHYGCGGIAAACTDKPPRGYVGDWLSIAARSWLDVEARLAEEKREVSREELLRLVVQDNVRLQIGHLRRLSVVRQCWDRTPGVPRLHGWVYDLASGRVEIVEDGRPGRG